MDVSSENSKYADASAFIFIAAHTPIKRLNSRFFFYYLVDNVNNNNNNNVSDVYVYVYITVRGNNINKT